jgi:hypothetical protein
MFRNGGARMFYVKGPPARTHVQSLSLSARRISLKQQLISSFFLFFFLFSPFPLLVLGGEDVRVSGVEDGEGGDVEELSAGGSELDVGSRVVVDVALGEHGVVLEGGLAEGGAVGRDKDELGLGGTKGLEGGLVAEGSLSGLHDELKTRVGVLGVLLGLLDGGHFDI